MKIRTAKTFAEPPHIFDDGLMTEVWCTSVSQILPNISP